MGAFQDNSDAWTFDNVKLLFDHPCRNAFEESIGSASRRRFWAGWSDF